MKSLCKLLEELTPVRLSTAKKDFGVIVMPNILIYFLLCRFRFLSLSNVWQPPKSVSCSTSPDPRYCTKKTIHYELCIASYVHILAQFLFGCYGNDTSYINWPCTGNGSPGYGMWQKSVYETATRLEVYIYIHQYEPGEEPGNEVSWMYEFHKVWNISTEAQMNYRCLQL